MLPICIPHELIGNGTRIRGFLVGEVVGFVPTPNDGSRHGDVSVRIWRDKREKGTYRSPLFAGLSPAPQRMERMERKNDGEVSGYVGSETGGRADLRFPSPEEPERKLVISSPQRMR